jgi:hypothetical protein
MFAQALLNEAHGAGQTELGRFPHYDPRRQDCFVQIYTIISLCLNEVYAVLRVPVHNSHSMCLSQSRVKELLDLAFCQGHLICVSLFRIPDGFANRSAVLGSLVNLATDFIKR